MTSILVKGEEILTVISNLALLVPCVIAYNWGILFTSLLLFVETWVSSAYHVCDYSGHCIFSFHTLHNLDFFFAQLLMVRMIIYLIHFTKYYRWIEWMLIIIGALIIVLLQILFSGELMVQSGIVLILFIGILIYWSWYYYLYKSFPPYRMEYFAVGLILMFSSAMLYTIQSVWPEGYSYIHSLWHISGAAGISYLILIKKPVPFIYNAANKVY